MIRRFARTITPAPVRRYLQRRKLERLVAAFRRRVVEHRYGDVSLRVELADPLAAGWYDHDWPLPAELAVLRRGRLLQGARVFDVGAHQGVVGLMLAQCVGSGGRVVLVEPNPHNAAQCVRNAELNDMTWVDVERAAVSDSNGTLRFNNGLNGAAAELSDYAGEMTVPAVMIDTLTARHGPPDVVFVDVEGFECRALAGATRTFAFRPDWFVEVHVGCGLEAAGGSVTDVLNHFPRSAFDRFVHSENEPEAIPLEFAPPAKLEARFFLTALSRRSADDDGSGRTTRR
jgi:FkbM family methyltransferase